MTLHTYNPQPITLPSINLLYLTISMIQTGQIFPAARPVTMDENNTPTALTGCVIKTTLVSVSIHVRWRISTQWAKDATVSES